MAPLVFITGASGFIGSETVVAALDKGYRTRVAIRRAEQADKLRRRFADTGRAHEIEFVVVPAIDDKAAIQPALEGVDYVLHVASPMPSTNLDLQKGYVQPAVRGTIAMLEAAEHVSSIKRMVIMSAYLAMAPLDIPSRNGYVVEEGTNKTFTDALDLEAPIPDNAYADVHKYHISKLMAHRAALDWVAEHKPQWDVLTVHPYYVIGYDRALAFDKETGAAKPRPIPFFYLLSLQSEEPCVSSAYVDVRDVAAMEIGAITLTKNLKPRGEITEIIALGPRITWPEMRDFVRTKFPQFPLKNVRDGNFSVPLTSNTDRATKDMGLVLRDPLESLSVTLAQHGPLKM